LCCRTEDSSITDDNSSSSPAYISSIDATGSGDNVTSLPCAASADHTVNATSPLEESSNQHGVDELQVTAESPKVVGGKDDGSGDGVLEVCDSRTSEAAAAAAIVATAAIASAFDDDDDVRFNDNQMLEVEVCSLSSSDQQGDFAKQFSRDQTATSPAAVHLLYTVDQPGYLYEYSSIDHATSADAKWSPAKRDDTEVSEVEVCSLFTMNRPADTEEQFGMKQTAKAAAADGDDNGIPDDDNKSSHIQLNNSHMPKAEVCFPCAVDQQVDLVEQSNIDQTATVTAAAAADDDDDDGGKSSEVECNNTHISDVATHLLRISDSKGDSVEQVQQFSIDQPATAVVSSAAAADCGVFDDNEHKSSNVEFIDGERPEAEVHSACTSGQQVDLAKQFSMDHTVTVAVAAADYEDNDGCSKSNPAKFTDVSCTDDYTSALLISSLASSSLSSFTITPCSSVTVDNEPMVDSSPYQLVVSTTSELLPFVNDSYNVQDGASASSYVESSLNTQGVMSAVSYISSSSDVQDVILSSNTCSTQHCVPTDETGSKVASMPAISHTADVLNLPLLSTESTDETLVSSKAASMSAVSHGVNAFNLPLLSTKATDSVLNPIRFSAAVVFDDGGQSASESVLSSEQSNEYSSNLVFLENGDNEDFGNSSIELREEPTIAEYRSVDTTANSRFSRMFPASVVTSGFNCKSSEVAHATVDNESGGIIECQSAADGQSSSPYCIPSTSAVTEVLVTFCESMPIMYTAAGSTAVSDSWSSEGLGAVKDQQANDSSLSTVPSVAISALTNADINTSVLPSGAPTVPLAVNLCSVNADDVFTADPEQCSAEFSADRSEEKSNASQLTVMDDLLALKQVSFCKAFKFSPHMQLIC